MSTFFEPYEVKLCICRTRPPKTCACPGHFLPKDSVRSYNIGSLSNDFGMQSPTERNKSAIVLRMQRFRRNTCFFPADVPVSTHQNKIVLPSPHFSERCICREISALRKEGFLPIQTPRHAAQYCSLLLFRRARLFAFPPFSFLKSRRLSLKSAQLSSNSPQLLRESAEVFILTSLRSLSRWPLRTHVPPLSVGSPPRQRVEWESGNVCLAVRRGIRKFAAN